MSSTRHILCGQVHQKIGTSIKRTIERNLCKVDNTSELFCKIESLYNDDTNVSLGPACSFAEIDAAAAAPRARAYK